MEAINQPTIERNEAVTWIKENREKEFVVRFMKRNGDIRQMKCVYGIEKNLVNNPNNPGLDHESKGLICVYDLEKEAYRSFHVGELREIKQDPNSEKWLKVVDVPFG